MKDSRNNKTNNYRICSTLTPEDMNNREWIFTIQNINTAEIKKICLTDLILDASLLAQFNFQDIFMIAYIAAQKQILCEKRWVCRNNGNINCRLTSTYVPSVPTFGKIVHPSYLKELSLTRPKQRKGFLSPCSRLLKSCCA